MNETVLTILASGALFGYAGWLLRSRQLSSKVQCRHWNRREIYGDEIYMAAGHRLQCQDCGALLLGPVTDATKPPRPLREPHDSYSEGEEL